MKPKTVYVCSACGGTSMQWKGQCPGCGAWNTLEARAAASGPGRVASRRAALARGPVSLAEPAPESGAAFASGLAALDELLGPGLVPGSTVLVAGEPGIGKSTLLLQMAGGLAAQGRRAVYVSAEESLPQLRKRAERLGLLHPGLEALDSTALAEALAVLEGPGPPDLMVVDSVQTMSAGDGEGLPGSPNQVRAVATVLSEAARRVGAALVLVGHVTKDGQIAGPKLLEHMVDTVLSLEGERRDAFRVLKVLKNRFGPSFEMLVLRMSGAGLEVVADPSTFFLQDRDPSLPGTALVMGVSGRRPFAVEVQALVSRSFLSIPRRTALGFDANRLYLLLAVLEKHLRLNFGAVDIYAKIGGGLKLADPGLDLGIVAAVLSSFYDRALPEAAAFWGEVDLNGQVRPVHAADVRARQAQRLGYGPVFHPVGEGEGRAGCRTVAELQARLFGKSGS